MYHGQGSLAFSNGDKYIGEFEAGRYHGRGNLPRKNTDENPVLSPYFQATSRVLTTPVTMASGWRASNGVGARLYGLTDAGELLHRESCACLSSSFVNVVTVMMGSGATAASTGTGRLKTAMVPRE
jgi:hypothetical protein